MKSDSKIPLRRRSRRLAVLAWAALALLALPAVPAVALFVFTIAGAIDGTIELPTPQGFALLLVLGVLGRLVVGVITGGHGLTEAEMDRNAVAHESSELLSVVDPTEDLEAYATWLDAFPPVDVDRELPALRAFVIACADDAGANPPGHLMLRRAGYAVRTSDDGTVLSVGSGFLLAASIEELRAEIVRHLAQRRSPAWSQLRLARTVVTATTYARYPGIFELPFWPAALLGRVLRRRTVTIVGTLRNDAEATTARLVGHDVMRSARDRALAAPQLWREHLARLQRRWTNDSTMVAPHETWRATWTAVPADRSIRPAAHDVVEPTDLRGWRTADPGPVKAPTLASPCALEILAGPDASKVLMTLDQIAASQYNEPQMTAVFGEGEHHDPHELVPDPVAAPILVTPSDQGVYAIPPDPSWIEPGQLVATADDPTPHMRFIACQLDALEQAMVRRDAGALGLAIALDDPRQAPTVQALAAGVRWLSGDPQGAAAIASVIGRMPRAAALLVPLVHPLHAAGEHAVADAILAAEAAVGRTIRRRVSWNRLSPRSGRLVAVDVPPVVRAALAELTAQMTGARQSWIADLRAPEGDVPRSVLVVRYAFITTGTPSGTEKERQALAASARLVWPLTIQHAYGSVDGRDQKRLRKQIPELWSKKADRAARRARPAL